MSGGILSQPASRNASPDPDDWGVVSRVIGGPVIVIIFGTVDQGNPNTLANGWPVKITDGLNVLGTFANPIRIDPTGTTVQPTQEVRSTAAAPSSIPQSAVSVVLLAANAVRKGMTIENNSTANLFVQFGPVSAIPVGYAVKMIPGAYFEMPFNYVGVISGIWDSAGAGTAEVTEET